MVFRAIHADATEMMFFSQIVVVEDLIDWLEQSDPRYAYVPADYVEPPELQAVTAEAPRIDADTISRVRKPLGEGSFGTVVSATTWKQSWRKKKQKVALKSATGAGLGNGRRARRAVCPTGAAEPVCLASAWRDINRWLTQCADGAGHVLAGGCDANGSRAGPPRGGARGARYSTRARIHAQEGRVSPGPAPEKRPPGPEINAGERQRVPRVPARAERFHRVLAARRRSLQAHGPKGRICGRAARAAEGSHYSAPELLSGYAGVEWESFDIALEKKCDVWSYGAVLAELLTGEAPWAELSKDALIAANMAGAPPPPIPEYLADYLAGGEEKERVEARVAAPELLELVTDCLTVDPAARPLFDDDDVVERLDLLLKAAVEHREAGADLRTTVTHLAQLAKIEKLIEDEKQKDADAYKRAWEDCKRDAEEGEVDYLNLACAELQEAFSPEVVRQPVACSARERCREGLGRERRLPRDAAAGRRGGRRHV